MNKIVLSLLIIGTIVSIAGAGTWAYFSDTEQATGNTFTAGTLDLKVNGADGTGVGHYTETNWKPGEPRNNNVVFTNAGSLNGNLSISVANIAPIADTCSLEFCNHAANLGGANFDVVITEGVTPIYSGILSSAELAAGVNVGALDASATRTLNMQATLNSGVGNDAQGDGISFDIVATLNQQV